MYVRFTKQGYLVLITLQGAYHVTWDPCPRCGQTFTSVLNDAQHSLAKHRLIERTGHAPLRFNA